MDTKIEIKEEDPLSDDVALQKEQELFTKLPNEASVVAIKTEIKSETLFPDFCSQKDRDCCAKQVMKQISSESGTCSTNYEIYIKTDVTEQTVASDFGSQNNTEFFQENPITRVKKCSSDDEVNNKIEVKVEPWWMETEISSGCDETKDMDFPPIKSSRLCMEADCGDSHINLHLSSAKVSGRDTSSYNEKDHPEYGSQECDERDIPTVEKYIHSEQFGKCGDGEIYIKALHSKQRHLIHKDKRAYKCNICDKRFKYMSHLKQHEFIHRQERPYQCKNCDKSFTQLSNLKTHNLIHEGKKPHECKTCNKRFTQLTSLKKHNLIHEGKKPHECKICDKRFTQLSHLKTHTLFHEGKKPHQCKICDKSFSQLANLRKHNLVHEGKRQQQS